MQSENACILIFLTTLIICITGGMSYYQYLEHQVSIEKIRAGQIQKENKP